LLKELEKYGTKPVLLKPVGSFKAEGEENQPVYDLGGNAAEWTAEGKARGGSAERPNDTKSEIQPLPHYTGLRIVKAGK
jgi:formylglycine-generating enzyme required for sulfatase activity